MLFAPILLLACLLLPIVPSQSGLCSMYPELEDASWSRLRKPAIKPKSAIGKIFTRLESINATLYNDDNVPRPYYSWKCTSRELKGKMCTWVMPYAYLVGMSKCGTTALCNKLELYPEIQFYYTKEVNIFSKHTLQDTWTTFENKIVYRHSQEKTDMLLQKFWFDCSGGTYRDINAAAYLHKYSPQTKLLFIVRDPWQKLGSLITMLHRDHKFKKDYSRLKEGFSTVVTELERMNAVTTASRFKSSAIRTVRDNEVVGQFMFAEKLLTWRGLFGARRVLLIDSYELETSPQQVMTRIEEYLGLVALNFTDVELFGTSHNTVVPRTDSHRENGEMVAERTTQSEYQKFISKGKFEVSRDPVGRKRAEYLKQHVISNNSDFAIAMGLPPRIHEPYVFTDLGLFRDSKKLFGPSLCLYQRIFNRTIAISTNLSISS